MYPIASQSQIHLFPQKAPIIGGDGCVFWKKLLTFYKSVCDDDHQPSSLLTYLVLKQPYQAGRVLLSPFYSWEGWGMEGCPRFCKVKVKSLSHVWLFATPWTVAYQAPQSMEFSRQEYWSGLSFPSPGDLPNPGIEPRSPALQADALPFCTATQNDLKPGRLAPASKLPTLCHAFPG